MVNIIPWKRAGSGVQEPLARFHQDMDRLFEDFFGEGRGSFFATQEGYLAPAIDMVESKDALIARVEMPGIDPKEIEIGVTGDVLTLSGEKKQEESKEGENYLFAERRWGAFRRSFRLPSWADPDKIDAQFRNGVLELTIGKREEAKPKTIQVRVKN